MHEYNGDPVYKSKSLRQPNMILSNSYDNYTTVAIHESETTVKSVDNVVQYLNKEYKGEVKIGKVYTMRCDNLSES